ncbi:MAG: DUF983 domain-containing protein [Bacteroidetes bacterium]|nr:DUF983 domain-containing protein [Bacteroidota bacterium]MCX6337273.1 DUF983 domain-containing protein [Bacteroidota bacterium]
MSVPKKKPFYLWSIFNNRCPRCREGKIFTYNSPYNFSKNMQMPKTCPSCGQPTELEVGFYYGTGYVSYGLSVAFTVATFVAWKVLIGMTFDIDDNRIFYWLATDIILLILTQPLQMRLSRTLWLSWFVSYDAKWKEHEIKQPERIVEGQMNNW